MEALTKDMSDKIAMLRELVLMKANTECAEIRHEMDDYHTQKLSKYRGSFSAEVNRQTEMDAQEATRAADTEIARRKEALKQQLYAFRMQKCEIVFENARKQLLTFTQTPEYGTFLKEKAKAARALFSEESVTVLVRPSDLSFAEMLKQTIGACVLEADAHIQIGGLMVKNTIGLVADETLDTALQEEKTQFYNSCGAILAD